MRILAAILLALVLVGCSNSELTRQENRRQWELVHNMNITRVRHFDEETKTLFVAFSYHSPAYFWYQKKDSTLAFIWVVIDIRDSTLFFPPEMTDFKTFNRLEDRTDYNFVIKEAVDYYFRGREDE